MVLDRGCAVWSHRACTVYGQTKPRTCTTKSVVDRRGDPCGRPHRDLRCRGPRDGTSPSPTALRRDADARRGDPCGRPHRDLRCRRRGTGQARPLRRSGAMRTLVGATLVVARTEICVAVVRGTGQARPLRRSGAMQTLVGATLVVARTEICVSVVCGTGQARPRRRTSARHWDSATNESTRPTAVLPLPIALQRIEGVVARQCRQATR